MYLVIVMESDLHRVFEMKSNLFNRIHEWYVSSN